MEQNRNRLDDFLRQKIDEADFHSSSDDWKRMAELLDRQDEQKKGGWWRWLLFGGALLIVSGIAFWLLHPAERSLQTATAPQATTQVQAEHEKLPVSDVVTDQKEKGSGKEDTIPSSSDSEAASNPISRSEQTSHKETQTISVDPNEDKVKKVQRNRKHKDPSGTNPLAGSQGIEAQKEQNESASDKQEKPKNNNQSRLEQIAASIKVKSGPEKKDKKQQGETNKNGTEKSENEHHTPDTYTKHQGNESAKGGDTNRFVRVVQVPVNGKYHPRYVPGLEGYQYTQIDSVTVITYPPEINPKVTRELIWPDTSLRIRTRLEVLRIYLLASLNMNPGWKGNAQQSKAIGFSPGLGLGVEKQVAQKLYLSAHIGFTYSNALNSYREAVNHSYSFGIDSSVTRIEYLRILQLCVPFMIRYPVLPGHSIMALAGWMYHLDVQGTYKEAGMTSNAGYSGVNTKTPAVQTQTVSGYRNAIQPWDIYFGIGYAAQWKKNLQFQLMFQQGIRDVSKDSYFNNSQTNTQSRLSIGLRYTFKRN
ncbi:MAG TPA: hypothetical protein PLP34_07155 [Chitinophagaceae bacterium]|nr:hypothetical protein [Chitinophagaceae bacterium]